MKPIRFKGNILVPAYIKESIRSLIRTVSDQEIDITIEKHKKAKTDPQRKYFWELVKQLRSKMKGGMKEWDIYLWLLRVHGTSEWVNLPEDQVHIAKAYYRIVDDKGPANFTDPSGREYPARQLLCWKGLSEYSTDEACMLIDGAIEECKEQGIPTDTPEDLLRYKEVWGVEVG